MFCNTDISESPPIRHIVFGSEFFVRVGVGSTAAIHVVCPCNRILTHWWLSVVVVARIILPVGSARTDNWKLRCGFGFLTATGFR